MRERKGKQVCKYVDEREKAMSSSFLFLFFWEGVIQIICWLPIKLNLLKLTKAANSIKDLSTEKKVEKKEETTVA